MSAASPLDHPRLQAVAQELDAGNLDGAQRRLAEIGDIEELSHGIRFLATRLLFLRGRLDPEGVVQRLRELVREAGSFPEAEVMLALAEGGRLRRSAPVTMGPSESQELLSSADIESLAPGSASSHPPPRVAPDPIPPLELGEEPALHLSNSPTVPAPPGAAAGAPDGETRRPSPLRLSFHELRELAPPATDPVTERPAAPSLKSLGQLDALIAIDELWSDTPAAGSSRPAARRAREEPTRPALAIPPAPALPRIAPPSDSAPSHLPPESRGPVTAPGAERPRLSERVRGEIVSDGRYALQSATEEVVWPAGSPPPPSSPCAEPPPGSSQPPTTTGQPVGKIRSGRPPEPSEDAAPTLFEVATLLDQGRFGRALEALGNEDASQAPEHVLMRVRALVGVGRRADALATLDRLVARPELDADHRAASARLLVELGELEQALEQARLSSTQAPDSPLARLTHAWAAVRLARRTGLDELVHEAERLLLGLKSRGSPHPALLFALRACIHAHVGDAQRAISIAQRALALVPESPDALAAVALGSARLGRTLDAQRASLRLVDVAHEEAAALTLLFERMGLRLDEPSEPTEEPRACWDALEMAWLDGRLEPAVTAFERTCRERLSELAEAAEEPSFPLIGAAGGALLSVSPVWSHFAPYDFSLYSLERVNQALGLLYDGLPQPRPDADDFPVQVLIGSYLGETLCRANSGRWEGSVAELERVRVVAAIGSWHPFVTLGTRLTGSGPLEFGALDPPRLAHPGAEPWAHSTPVLVVPPCPWDPEAWPNSADIPALGQALKRSVVSSYCARHAGGPLDGTISSLAALEKYLNLLAPAKSRIEPTPPWARRAATLCGAYLGEVLRSHLEGRWLVPHDGVLGPDSYRLRIGTLETAPVATVLARITGRSATPIHEHAARLIGRGR